MLEYGLRFLAGGIAVSAFAALGDTLRPKSFAGLFMIVGAFALAAYSWVVCVLLKKFLLSSRTATIATLIVWFVVAFGVSAALFQLS